MEIKVTIDKAGGSSMKTWSLGVDFYIPVPVCITVKISYTWYKYRTGYVQAINYEL